MKIPRPVVWCLGIVLLACTAPEARSQSVYISEFMASNQDTLDDEDGDSSDWIELFNNTSSPVDLDGWYLTDDPALLTKWQFPGVTLGAGQFLIVFASDKNRTDPAGQLHTNFKLASGGDYIALVRDDGTTVEHDFGSTYPAQITDVSYGLGMSGGSTVLLDQGDPLRYKIPTNGNDDVDDDVDDGPQPGSVHRARVQRHLVGGGGRSGSAMRASNRITTIPTS